MATGGASGASGLRHSSQDGERDGLTWLLPTASVGWLLPLQLKALVIEVASAHSVAPNAIAPINIIKSVSPGTEIQLTQQNDLEKMQI
jgi:hypothetical protein